MIDFGDWSFGFSGIAWSDWECRREIDLEGETGGLVKCACRRHPTWILLGEIGECRYRVRRSGNDGRLSTVRMLSTVFITPGKFFWGTHMSHKLKIKER